MLSRSVGLIFYFYYLLIIIRIFLSWLPSIDWRQQPYRWLSSICDPFLNVFRGVIPPIGGVLDISPIIAIILLQLLQGLVVGMLTNMGL